MFGFMKRLGIAAAGGTAIPGGLTGTFDLHGTTLTGWVHAIPYATNAGVVVEVVRQGRAIAACQTGPDNGHGQLRFTLPMQGRFTEAEIAHETVIITARSQRGDTGTLKLDGATQLGLVRAHLGVPVETWLDLDFSRNGNARPHLGVGWSGAEENYTWTENDDSLVHFPTPTAPGPYLLRLTCGAFVNTLVPTQRMEILVNENAASSFVADSGAADFREFRIDPALFGTAPTSTLRLHHPYAAQPSAHADSGDHRRLAFSVRRLTLVRLLPLDG